MRYNKATMREGATFRSSPRFREKEVLTLTVSKAQQKAVNKYVKDNYDKVLLTMPKGKKDTIKEHAGTQGESVNAFINRAIDNQMEQDKKQQ